MKNTTSRYSGKLVLWRTKQHNTKNSGQTFASPQLLIELPILFAMSNTSLYVFQTYAPAYYTRQIVIGQNTILLESSRQRKLFTDQLPSHQQSHGGQAFCCLDTSPRPCCARTHRLKKLSMWRQEATKFIEMKKKQATPNLRVVRKSEVNAKGRLIFC